MNMTFKQYEALAKKKSRKQSERAKLGYVIDEIEEQLEAELELSSDLTLSIDDDECGLYLELDSSDHGGGICIDKKEAVALRDALNKLFPKKGR